MQASHFSDGHTANFSIERKRRVVELYDPMLNFNRIVEQKPNDPQSIIYSIDSAAFLQKLQDDDLGSLYTLTLACRQTRSGISMWDALFNEARHHAMTSCVFLTQHNYSPIPADRVMYTSQFLNFTMPVTRSHLNHVIPGDRLGIAINDVKNEHVYVLLYLVEDFGMAIKNHAEAEKAMLIPAVNIKLEHAFKLDNEGELIVSSMEEDAPFDEEKAKPFVEWLIDTVDDIGEGFPWKPHFLPFIPREIKRQIVEEHILHKKDLALDVSYDEFEQICRKAYHKVREQRRPAGARIRPGARDHNPRHQPQTPAKPPVIEVVTIGDYYLTRFVLGNIDNDTTYRIHRDDVGKKAAVETFFTNKDLEHVLVDESSKVFVLSPGQFGDHAYLRFFSLSF